MRLTEKDIDRFWSKVKKADGCWMWQGSPGPGYGNFWLDGEMRRANRVSYLINFGPFDQTLCVCHTCDNPMCVRPDHLFLGTKGDNNADKTAKGRARGAVGDRNPSRLHPDRVPRGEQNGQSKLTAAQVQEIRRLYATGKTSHQRLAQQFGVSPRAIAFILKYRTWKSTDCRLKTTACT